MAKYLKMIFISGVSKSIMNHWISRFRIEIKTKQGRHYKPDTLVNIISGLQYRYEEITSIKLQFFEDPVSAPIMKALDYAMKLSSQAPASNGTLERSCSQPLTIDDEEQVWSNSNNILGSKNPVLFFNGLHFAVRGGTEHRNLLVSRKLNHIS